MPGPPVVVVLVGLFASRDVNMLFNGRESVLEREFLVGAWNEGERTVLRVEVGRVFDKLQDTIRQELGADKIELTGGNTEAPPADVTGR
jgi:hypothetical protein